MLRVGLYMSHDVAHAPTQAPRSKISKINFTSDNVYSVYSGVGTTRPNPAETRSSYH